MTFRARLAEQAQGLKRELEVYRRVLGDARTPWLPKLLLGLAVGYALLPTACLFLLPVLARLTTRYREGSARLPCSGGRGKCAPCSAFSTA